jgi:3-dehydroquinate synthetase
MRVWMPILKLRAWSSGALTAALCTFALALLAKIQGIPAIPADISVGQLVHGTQRDNKKRDKGLAFILMEAIGRPRRVKGPRGESVLTPVPEEALRAALTEYRDALL